MTDELTPETELDFTAAFDRLAELGDKPVPADVLAPTPAEPAPAPAEPAPAEEPSPEPEAPITPEAAPAPVDDIAARIAALLNQPTPAPAPAEPAPSAPAAPEALYTPDEQQLITRYMDEWGEVATAEATIRRGEYKQLVAHVFEQIRAYLQPIEETVGTLAAETQIQQLRAIVPDYDQIPVDQVKAWVAQQPAYLQPSYNYVIEKGTPDEVADLLQRYNQSKAPVTPSAPPAPPAPKKSEPALPADAIQAASSLAPVSSKRSAVAPSAAPNDFDSAFAAAAATL